MAKKAALATPALAPEIAPPRARILDVTGAAEYLGLPLTTMRYWLIRPPPGLPAPLRSGNRMYFRAAELEKWAMGDAASAPAAPPPSPPPPVEVEVAMEPAEFPPASMPVRLAKRRMASVARFLEGAK